jgi:hypothetical protein
VKCRHKTFGGKKWSGEAVNDFEWFIIDGRNEIGHRAVARNTWSWLRRWEEFKIFQWSKWSKFSEEKFLQKKLAFFSKANVMIQFFHNLALFWVKNANFWAKIFHKS